MRIALLIVVTLAVAACRVADEQRRSDGGAGHQSRFGAQVGDAQPVPAERRDPPEYGFPALNEKPRRAVWLLHGAPPSAGQRLTRKPERSAKEYVVLGGYYVGGWHMSYDPELRRMGLKVGRDGQLHEIGPDARHPDDPDEGPVVGWDELHRGQFGR